MFGNSSKTVNAPDVEARLVGNTLVAQFFSGETPRTWRADLTGLLSAVLEVREAQPGRFRLVMKKDGGQEEEIATFNDKDKATGALRVLTGAMLEAETGGARRVSAGTAAAPGSPRGFLGGFLRFTLWVAGLFVLLFILKVALNPVQPGTTGRAGGGMSAPSTVKPGAPVPADQLFGN